VRRKTGFLVQIQGREHPGANAKGKSGNTWAFYRGPTQFTTSGGEVGGGSNRVPKGRELNENKEVMKETVWRIATNKNDVLRMG